MNTDTPPQLAHGEPQINYSVSWTEGVINLSENESLEGASVWVLKIGDRTILHAVQQSPIHEAVSASDRRLVGQAVADALSTDSAVEVHSKETMDEVREALQAAEEQLRGYEVQIDGEWGCCRDDEEMEQEKLWGGAIYATRSVLAKLNPPQ